MTTPIKYEQATLCADDVILEVELVSGELSNGDHITILFEGQFGIRGQRIFLVKSIAKDESRTIINADFVVGKRVRIKEDE